MIMLRCYVKTKAVSGILLYNFFYEFNDPPADSNMCRHVYVLTSDYTMAHFGKKHFN